MTYSPSHVTPATRQVEAMAAVLRHDLATVCTLAEMCDAVSDMRGRRPPSDPDNTGRRASAGPGRPTEDTALDDARLLVIDELATAATHMKHAAALVKGTAAALDRALSVWEGESAIEGAAGASAGDTNDHRAGSGATHGADGDA